MDEWVHCNLCGQTLVRGLPFFLTTCAHLFCVRCKDKGTDPVCAICKAHCKAKELNEKLDANMQAYFSSPIKQNEKLVEISKFQAQHRTMLIGHLKKKIELQRKKLKSAEEYVKKQNEEINQLRYDQSVLKKYISSYKAHSSGYSHHKPITPRQLSCSPSMMSPMHSRSQMQSPMVTGGHNPRSSMKRSMQSPAQSSAASKHLGEIQNTPDIERMSIRPRPSNGVMGTPSPHSIPKSGSSHPSHINSSLVVSTDPKYRDNASSNSKLPSTVWTIPKGNKGWPTPPCTPKQPPSAASVKSNYFSKIDQTPPCTPRRPPLVLQPPSHESTPMLKFYKTNFR